MTDFLSLARVRLDLHPVDALHRPVSKPGMRLHGVAEILPQADDLCSTRAHLLRWQASRDDGMYWRQGLAEPSDSRVADVLRRFDRGPVGVLAGDPVSLLAAELRQLRDTP